MARAMGVAMCFMLLACALGEASNEAKNPIRKVVTMLQNMQKSIEESGKKEQELFDKFMCYCTNGAGQLDLAIQTGESNVDTLNSKIQEETALKSQMVQDLKQHKVDRDEANKVTKESTAMRKKEASEFAASSGEMKANIAATANALGALKKGLGYAMVQTGTGDFLRNLVKHSPVVKEFERDTLMSFLDSSSGSQSEGSSDQIIGIVETMKEEMESDLEETTSSEEQAKSAFQTLMESKQSEIAAATKAIETKTVRSGEIAVSLTQAKADVEDTAEAFKEDKKFKANLERECSTKQGEWDTRSKMRAQEIAAVSETIEILNDDDALDLFKKALPTPSSALIQVDMDSQTRLHAYTMIKRLLAHDPEHAVNLRMVMMMLKSHSGGGFDKVVKMVDDMVTLLGKEQVDDDDKRDFCHKELDRSEDDEKALARTVKDLETSIEDQTDTLEGLKSEIAGLQKGIADLDRMVAEATEQRKEEHESYTDSIASNSAALQLLGMAQNRMNKFYNPTLYKAPPTTTESASAYGFIQLARRSSADPGPAPATFGGELKKSEGSTGIIAMLSEMMRDVEMDTKEAEHDEKDAQEDYQTTMNDATTKRGDDSKLIVEKESAKASHTEELASMREMRSSKRDQLQIAQEKIDDLHKSCDFLLDNYDERKKNRATESDGLKQAKAVLHGASFGL